MSPELPEPDLDAPRGKGIGTATLRKEDAELITGQGRYVDDVKLPGMLHLAFVRSQVAHGKLGDVDTAAALAVPGVVAVYTADDLEFQAGVPCGSNPTGDAVQPERWPLARGKVRHVGEPIAVVVAEDRYAAADGAAAVQVSVDPLPAVTSAEEARREGAPAVHDEAPDNLCCTISHATDGFDAAIAGAE